MHILLGIVISEVYDEIFSDSFLQNNIPHTVHTEKHPVEWYPEPHAHTTVTSVM